MKRGRGSVLVSKRFACFTWHQKVTDYPHFVRSPRELINYRVILGNQLSQILSGFWGFTSQWLCVPNTRDTVNVTSSL